MCSASCCLCFGAEKSQQKETCIDAPIWCPGDQTLDTPHHASPDTAWISHILTPFLFPTPERVLSSFRIFIFHRFHCFCSPACTGFSRPGLLAFNCKANSSQQLVPNTQLRSPTFAFTHPVVPAVAGVIRVEWCGQYMTQCMKRTCQQILLADPSPGCWSKGKTTAFYGSQRQATPLPNHGKTYFSCPPAVHTTMPLTL